MEDHGKWLLGMCYVMSVAVIWIAASYIVQGVEKVGVAPFLLTYICNSLFILYLPILALIRSFARLKASGYLRLPWVTATSPSSNLTEAKARTSEVENLLPSSDGEVVPSAEIATPSSAPKNENRGMDILPPLPALRKIAAASLWVCPFWFAAQLTYNYSLNLTSVTSNTILSSTSNFFVFLVSVLSLGEKFTWVKLVSIVFTVAGSIVVSFSDTSSLDASSDTLLGDILCLISAMAYAVYTILIRVKLPDDDSETMMAFLGFLGAFNALIFAGPLLILQLLGLLNMQALSLGNFLLIISKGLFDNVLSDFMWARAVLLMTPTAATVGLSIQIPIAAIADYFIMDRLPGRLMLLGGLLVVIGFFGINASGSGFCGGKDAVDEDAETSEAMGTPLAELKGEALDGVVDR